MMARLSIVIPTYNRASFLKEVLYRFTKQSLPPEQFEIIVVDDGSSDSTQEVVASFWNGFRLTSLVQEHAGPYVGRNLGFSRACGDIVLFFDDEVADSNLLKEHLETHREHPQEEVAVLGYTTWSSPLRMTPMMRYLFGVGYSRLSDGEILNFNYFWCGRLSCKKSFLMRRGTFNPTLFRQGDIELGYRLSRFGLKAIFNRKAINYMR